MKSFKPLDFVIFALIIFASIFLFKTGTKSQGNVVSVNADGTEYQFSLSEDGIFQVKGAAGITCIEIKDKKVRIIDSPCPEKICVHQGWGNSIVCLPNKVIISVDQYGEFDAITQ